MPPLPEPSKKAIDRAGLFLCDWWAADDPIDDDTDPALEEAFRVVSAYRSNFRYPLIKVTVTMRDFVRRESGEIIVSSRLKRLPTILDKLKRHPHMKLTRMQDIGGCRAILPGGLSEIKGVMTRIVRNWDVVEVYDYVTAPKPTTGYRALHVVVRRDGRLIEIQLRTPNQNLWALEIERTGSRLDIPHLKDGVGPPDLVRYFELASYVLGVEDLDEEADDGLQQEFRDLRGKVGQYFVRAR